jgi:hypothetical protein
MYRARCLPVARRRKRCQRQSRARRSIAKARKTPRICYSARTMTFVKARGGACPVYRVMRAFLLLGLLVPAGMLLGQQTPVVPPPAPAKPGPSGANAGSAVPKGESAKPSNAEFAAAADEVLQEMSQITGLAQRTPVKKTLRSREEIRAYVIREMNEDKEPAERYNSARSAEALGLLPAGFDLDNFMVDLLTEQIAGLYDPKTEEFYIADWIAIEDQRMVMAHELTHALQDQHYKIEAWVKAARPNDDAELARESVLEGSAMAAMIDYLLLDKGLSIKDVPDIDPNMMVGDLGDTPLMKKAPMFLRDSLIFPYIAGLTFSSNILKPSGWSAMPRVFAKPPVSSQQIMHPALYKTGKIPAVVTLPDVGNLLGAEYSKLEDNVLGEFGWKEVLKQFLDDDRAAPLAAAWQGDRYQVYEQKRTKHLVLITHIQLSGATQAARFFGQFSEALEKKHPERTNLFRRADFFSFTTPDGDTFLHCSLSECITVEGATRPVFDAVNKAANMPAPESGPIDPAKPPTRTTSITTR